MHHDYLALIFQWEEENLTADQTSTSIPSSTLNLQQYQWKHEWQPKGIWLFWSNLSICFQATCWLGRAEQSRERTLWCGWSTYRTHTIYYHIIIISPCSSSQRSYGYGYGCGLGTIQIQSLIMSTETSILMLSSSSTANLICYRLL